MAVYVPVLSPFEDALLPMEPFRYSQRMNRRRPRRCGGRPGCHMMARPFFDDFFASFDDDAGLVAKRSKDGSKDFRAAVDVSGFSPEEVEVSVDGNVVNVSAKSEKEENGCKTYKKVKRTFTVPAGCDLENLQAKVNTEGRMEITAPAKVEKIEMKEDEAASKMEVEKQQKVDVEINKEATVTKEDNTSKRENHDEEQEVMEEDTTAKEDEATNTPTPFWAEVDVRGFDAEHLKVEATDSGRVRVTGRKENDDGSNVKSFTNEFAVDGDLYDLSSLKSEMKEGVLVLQAQPRKKQEKRKEVINIPVNVL